MSYPTRSVVEGNDYYNYNNNNISVGYPKFSDIHEYPNLNKQNMQNQGIADPYYQKYQKQKKQMYYNNPPQKQKQPMGKIDKYQKHQNYPVPPKQKKIPKQKVAPKKKKQYINPPIQAQSPLYMDQTGQKYIAVPVGPPQLMPVVVPQYQMPYYQGQAMYTPPPYYGQQQQVGPNTVVVIPPGYNRDYSAGYSPYGNIIDDIDYMF